MVPKEWIAPPDFDTADGELLDEDEHNDSHEGSRMLGNTDTSHQRWSVDNGSRSFEDEWSSEEERSRGGNGKGKGKAPVRDTSGRVVPPADIAPTVRGKQSREGP